MPLARKGVDLDRRRYGKYPTAPSMAFGTATRATLYLQSYPREQWMIHLGAEIRLFPACRKESTFVLSIKPEPVSTKLGIGA
jgi:hypothetical protein